MSDNAIGARTRAAAARVVDAVVRKGKSLDTALIDNKSGVPAQDRSLLRMLSYGALRYHWRLAAQVDALLHTPLKARDGEVHALLVIGVFQLTDTRIRDHASVSLTVEAVRLLRRPKLKGLVNAVLRSFLRKAPQPRGTDEVRFNHPDWLIKRIRADWPDHWERILDSNNHQAPMWLRVNEKRLSVDGYLEKLATAAERPAADLADTVPGIDGGIRLAAPWSVEDLPGFADGDVSVQDGAAQIAAPWLYRRGDERVLDACAAPGGKTAHLKELAAPGVTLTAIDSDPARVERIHENLARLGLTATVLSADASKPKGWWDSNPFDAVLLDAPCSASGVIRRHPDIKHNRRESDLVALAETQSGLLAALWRLVRPGGRLLYVTCSVIAAENEDVVARFLETHAEAKENRVLQNNNIQALMVPRTQGFQILPGTQGLDGFYFACLEKPA